MRALWIDHGADVDYVRAAKHGITEFYFDVRDPRVTADYLSAVKGIAGVYACSQGSGWPDAHKMTGRAWADWVYERVQNEIKAPSNVKVCLNCEVSDADWIVQMLKRWRAHSPRRSTSWSPEGRKAGLFSQAHVAAINKTAVTVLPQFYTGDMTAHPEGSVTLPMLQKGFVRLSGFFDAANLPYDWSGMAFIQSRLPSVPA